MASKTLHIALDTLATDAQRAATVHCQHRGMDYRRDWPAALADLRTDAHYTRLISSRKRGKRLVYADRFYGYVLGPCDSLAFSQLAGSRAWTRTHWPSA